MRCTGETRFLLFIVYVASIISALANPANLDFQDAYLMTQGANVTMLLLLAYCKGSLLDTTIAAALGAAFAARASGSWQGGSRWDALLVTIGMLIILQDAFYALIPAAVKHRFWLYLAFSCLVMPVLSALPHLFHMPSLTREELLGCAEHAQLGYRFTQTKEDEAKVYWKLIDKPTDTRAGVRRRGGDVYVFFAGSTSLENWKTNVNILGDSVPADWGCNTPEPLRTHKGYTKAFLSVATQMLAALETEIQRDTTTRIFFVGHSLGGALATMAALYTACKLPRYKPLIHVVTFGSPQVGDSNFVSFFNSTIHTSMRVVNPLDPVPRLLSAQLVHVKGYYPVGQFSLKFWDMHFMPEYTKCLQLSRVVSILAAFLPAVLGASIVVAYITWVLKRQP